MHKEMNDDFIRESIAESITNELKQLPARKKSSMYNLSMRNMLVTEAIYNSLKNNKRRSA